MVLYKYTLVLVLFSWSEIVARWCSLDSAHMRSLMLQGGLFLTIRLSCHLSGLSIIYVETS